MSKQFLNINKFFYNQNGCIIVITSFVGRNLKPYFDKDFDIKCTFIKGKPDDLTFEVFLKDKIACKTIIHLGDNVNDIKGISNEIEYYDVNY